MVQLSHPYVTTGKTIALTIRNVVSKVMSSLLKVKNSPSPSTNKCQSWDLNLGWLDLKAQHALPSSPSFCSEERGAPGRQILAPVLPAQGLEAHRRAKDPAE